MKVEIECGKHWYELHLTDQTAQPILETEQQRVGRASCYRSQLAVSSCVRPVKRQACDLDPLQMHRHLRLKSNAQVDVYSVCACSGLDRYLLYASVSLRVTSRSLFFRSTIAASLVPEQVKPWTYSDDKVLWMHSPQAYSQPHTRNIHKLA
jgi:hypothetical protein